MILVPNLNRPETILFKFNKSYIWYFTKNVVYKRKKNRSCHWIG